MADGGLLPNELFTVKLKENALPFHGKTHPYTYEQRKITKAQRKELIDAKFIKPSTTPWASPIILMPKPTRKGKKEWRTCIDYGD